MEQKGTFIMAKLFLGWMLLLTAIVVASSVTVEVDGPYYGPCSLCPEGPPGPSGPPGNVGLPGRDGRDGRDASCTGGAQTGSPAPVDQINDGGSGAVYIRWGRDVCAEGSELVYAGTAAGALYTHVGGGANYLCMPHDPIYDEHEAGGTRGVLYSSEYQLNDAISRLRPLHDHTPKCAVCKAPSGRSTKLMIPGRNVCPSEEWRLEYGGYLMSAYRSQHRTEFICFDREMEAEPGTGGNENGALFYMVTVDCVAGNGLPCGPYVDGQEITCAVCTI